jgi:diguanylate cyclase (GGDEF)-like protein
MKLADLRWLSLKTRITLFTLLVFLLGIWLLAIYGSRVLRQEMQAQLSEHQFSTVTLLAAQVNAELAERMEALKSAAHAITPARLADAASLQGFLEAGQVQAQLFNAGVYVTRMEGTAIASVPLAAGRVGINFLDQHHLAVTLQQGQSTISKPRIGKALHRPVFAMTAPIRDERGQVMGAVVGVVDLSQPNFLDKVTDNRFGKTGGYVLMSAAHRVTITATDKTRIMEPLPAPGVNPLMERYLQGYEGSGSVVDSRGVTVISSSRQIPEAGWVLVARIPAEEAFAPIALVQRRLLLAVLVFTIVAGGLIWWATLALLRRQLAPLLRATQALDSMTGADAALKPLPMASRDEIGDLIGGFNRLLALLAQRDEQVRQMAFQDPLTNLPNRRLLQERLSQVMAASDRSGRYGAVMYIDLDNFKPLNDQHGHAVGDLLLIEAAARLKACVRKIDTVARIGGDEFVLVIRELEVDRDRSVQEALAIAQKVSAALGKPYQLVIAHEAEAGAPVQHWCSASIGIELIGDGQTSLETIFERADAAMYEAKKAGPGSIRLHRPAAG